MANKRRRVFTFLLTMSLDPTKPWDLPDDVKLSELPAPLDLSQPRFNQAEYFGRVRHFMDVTDMRTLFTSDSKLEKARALVKAYSSGEAVPESTTVGEIYAAQKVVNAIIHPGMSYSK